MPPPATATFPLTTGVPAPARPALVWRAGLGLWGRESAGHTRPVAALPRVHSGVESAVKLLALVQLDQLSSARLEAALGGLLDLQTTQGPFAGCFRWYAEETEPTDTNASFFIGLALQLLALAHPERIPPSLRARLRDAFARLNAWFLAELERESPVYPNKYLGDLVCAWLGHELVGQPPPAALETSFAGAFASWETGHWGWGEHLSDVYSGVLLAELSALLVFARQLPGSLHASALRLARELLALDDYFGSGPRVPQIRCYDFAHSPARLTFRAQVETPWPAAPSPGWVDARALRRYMLLPFGPLLRARGWSALFPAPPPPTSADRTVLVAAGARAHAHVAPALRTGSLSRWPLLPGAEHQRWGLSWQTFPAAFWRPDGSWGFLRFTTRLAEDLRAHPAFEKSRAYLENALGPGEPPPLGLTACAQSGPAWVALRGLPAGRWDESTDGFWLHHLPTAPVVERTRPGWSTLRLDHPEGPLRLHHFPAPGQAAAQLVACAPGVWRWSAHAPAASSLLHLWALTAGPAPANGPMLTFSASECAIAWPDIALPLSRLRLVPAEVVSADGSHAQG